MNTLGTKKTNPMQFLLVRKAVCSGFKSFQQIFVYSFFRSFNSTYLNLSCCVSFQYQLLSLKKATLTPLCFCSMNNNTLVLKPIYIFIHSFSFSFQHSYILTSLPYFIIYSSQQHFLTPSFSRLSIYPSVFLLSINSSLFSSQPCFYYSLSECFSSSLFLPLSSSLSFCSRNELVSFRCIVTSHFYRTFALMEKI